MTLTVTNNAVEAMFVGCPVIAPNAGGITEIIQHNENGLLFSPNQPEDLRDKVQTLIDDAQLAEQLAAKASQYAMTHFTERALTQNLVEVYGEITRGV